MHRPPSRRGSRRALAAVAVAVLVLASGACGDDDATGGGSGGGSGPLIIGVLAPTTGASAQTAEQQVALVQMAAERINANGGLDGRDVEVKVYDTELKPEIAAQDAQRAITQDGVVALIGGYSTSEALAVREVADRSEVPFLTASASTPEVTEGSDFVFRVAPLSPDLVSGLVGVGKALGVTSPSVLHDSGGSGLFFGPLLESTADDLGLPPAGPRIEYPINATDVGAQVTAAAGQEPDGVFIGGSTGADHGLVAKAMVDQGLEVPLLGFSPIVLPDAVQIAGDAYTSLPAVYTVQTADTTKAAYQELLEAYNADNDPVENLPEQALQAYDAMVLVGQALEATVGEGGAALADALEALEAHEGVAGREGSSMDFTPDDHDAYAADYLNAYKMEDGQPVQDTELEF